MKEVLNSKSQFYFAIIGAIAGVASIAFFVEFGQMRHWMFSNHKEPAHGWP